MAVKSNSLLVVWVGGTQARTHGQPWVLSTNTKLRRVRKEKKSAAPPTQRTTPLATTNIKSSTKKRILCDHTHVADVGLLVHDGADLLNREVHLRIHSCTANHHQYVKQQRAVTTGRQRVRATAKCNAGARVPPVRETRPSTASAPRRAL